MAKPGSDEVTTQGHARIFRQPDGPGFDRQVKYAGVATQYLAIQGVSRAISGGRTPINVPDPLRRKAFRKVGSTVEAPDNSTFDLHVLHKRGGIPFSQSDLLCPSNYYVSVGGCKAPSDFLRGWESLVRVFYNAQPDDAVDEGDITGWDSDDQHEDTIPHTVDLIYSVGALNFGEQAGPQVDREVVDIAYGSNADCGACGPADDGTGRIYAVTKSSGGGSPGLPGEVIYGIKNTLTGTYTWGEATITNLGATADPVAIEVIGDKVVVLVKSEGAYYHATINSDTGIPGAFTKVTSGFVGAGGPNDIYSPDGVTAWIVGDAGYIYNLPSVGSAVVVASAATATTANLTRIDGDGEDTIVAVGANGTIVRSLNRGVAFGATSSAPTVGTNILTALAVVDDTRYFVGSSQGYVYATATGGAAWSEVSFSGSGAGAVYDILDVGAGVLYISHSTSTPTARIFSTWDGGRSWTNESPRINNLATFNRANRLAAPRVSPSSHTIAANNLAVAGLSGGGTDGVIYLGAASIV
jgi:photosystem II stability/assembly factor-like uncharacterized protein